MFYLISFPGNALTLIKNTIYLFFEKVFPFLFPFFILSTLLVKANLIKYIEYIFNPINKILFKTESKASSFLFIANLFSGNPGSVKLLSNLVNEEKISVDEGNNLLLYTCFANPLFIIGFIGVGFYKNMTVAYILLLSHFLSNIIIGILANIFKKIDFNTPEYKEITCKNPLKESVDTNFNTMVMILAIMILSNLLYGLIIDTHILDFVKNEEFKLFLLSSLEMTNGISMVFNSEIALLNSLMVISFLLAFGGVSIHLQSIPFIKEANLSYFSFFVGRIFQGVISVFLTIILFKRLYNPISPVGNIFLDTNLTYKMYVLLSIFLLYYAFSIFKPFKKHSV